MQWPTVRRTSMKIQNSVVIITSSDSSKMYAVVRRRRLRRALFQHLTVAVVCGRAVSTRLTLEIITADFINCRPSLLDTLPLSLRRSQPGHGQPPIIRTRACATADAPQA